MIQMNLNRVFHHQGQEEITEIIEITEIAATIAERKAERIAETKAEIIAEATAEIEEDEEDDDALII